MNRFEKAVALHKQGYNCNQSLLAAFTDVTGLSEQASFDLGAGFGAGMFTGEVCGAISSAVMVLGSATPVDRDDPVASKRRTGALAKEFQKRFQEKFGSLRCSALLKTDIDPALSPAAQAAGVSNRCEVLILSAMEVVEDMLAARA